MMSNHLVGINQRTKDYLISKVNNRMLFEHRKVWLEQCGNIPKGYMIHHINGDKKDNRKENLVCVSRKVHGKLHSKSVVTNPQDVVTKDGGLI